jgi:hypothetical protein
VLSVMMGSFLCHWFTAKYGMDFNPSDAKSMALFAGLQEPWAMLAYGLLVIFKIALGRQRFLDLDIAVLTYTCFTGIAIIFSWRILCKKIMRIVLPKVFRAFAQTFNVDLPTRKHYKAATYVFSMILLCDPN